MKYITNKMIFGCVWKGHTEYKSVQSKITHRLVHFGAD